MKRTVVATSCLMSALWLCGAEGATLITKASAGWRYAKGTAEATPYDRTAWRTNGFVDSGWTLAQAPIGYATSTDPEYAWLNEKLTDMKDNYSCLFLRHDFVVSDPTNIYALRLSASYDDAFIAWINGDRVRDINEPVSAVHYALASEWCECYDTDSPGAPLYPSWDLGLSPTQLGKLLVAGTNVLAIQVFNKELDSSDLFLDAELKTGVADTKFSHDRGFYSTAFVCTITTVTPGATIRYSLDGHDPSTGGDVVTGVSPLTVTIDPASASHRLVNGAVPPCVVLRAYAFKGSEEPTDVDTHTYIFLANVALQTNLMSGEDWVPATDSGGKALDRVARMNTEMDPDVVADPRYADKITNALSSIPTMSIAVEYAEMWGNSHGIFHNPMNWGDDWEYPVSVELIYPDGKQGFQINCGVAMAGAGSRRHPDAKHSLNLSFKSVYGASKLDYALFPNTPVRRFDSIRLRAQGNDKFLKGRKFKDTELPYDEVQYARDSWARQTHREMGWVACDETWAHLYINGIYWGLYSPTEKPTDSLMASYFGGDKEDYDVVGNKKWSACIPPPTGPYRTIDGTNTAWEAMTALSSLGTATKYAQMKEYLDITQYIDYTILEVWMANSDWAPPTRTDPGSNFRAGRKGRNRQPHDAQFTFFAWDCEAAMEMYESLDVNTDLNSDGIASLHDKLKANSDYRATFADRIYKHLIADDGVLRPDNATSRYTNIVDALELLLIPEAARWGDCREMDVQPITGDEVYENWKVFRDHLLDTWFPYRTDIVVNQYRAEGVYPSLSPPELSQHGGEVVEGFQLTISNPNGSGTIFYTTDGVDPRVFGVDAGDVSGSAISGGTLSTTVAISNMTRHVKARVKASTTWSALNEAIFNIAFSATDLRLTEIMFKPRDEEVPYVAGREFEFLEFKNGGGGDIDLSGFFLTGASLTFPPGTTVASGEFLLVVRSMTNFVERYGSSVTNSTQTLQWSSGGLSDNGEKIRLKNSDGNTVLSCEYDDDPPWPLGPDAENMGRSLVNTNPGGDPDNPKNWRASTNVDGSPGQDDPAPSYGLGVLVNEVMAHTDDTKGDKIELYNSGASAVDVGGWYVSDAYDPGNPGADYKLKKWQIPGSVVIQPGDYHVFYETAHSPAFGTAFQLYEWGDQVYLSSASAGNLSGYIVGAEFGASESQVALGRYETSVGEEDYFPALVSWTGSNVNSAPRVGPVVINEIMYDPPESGSCTNEFIELLNITGSSVDITDWDLEGAGGYNFPTTTVIQANSFLVLLDTNTSVSPGVFRAQHGIPGSVPIHGHNFDLGNNGEAIRLEKPNDDSDTNAPDILVDRVRYNDRAPWPTEAAGEGPSLERYVADAYGNEPLNWRADNEGGTPGTTNAFVSGTAIHALSNWRYHDKGSDLGTAWRAPSYSDSGWDDGDGLLGYGKTNLTSIIDYGISSSDKYPTYYFRKEFTIADEPGSISELKLYANYDDGLVAYINGQEVLRRKMSSSDPMPYTELATESNGSEGSYEENTITAHTNKLVKGRNVLAVEVHQISAGSSDIAWDARLTYSVSTLPSAAVDIVPHGQSFTDPINVAITSDPTNATIYYTTDGSTPGAGDDEIVSGNSIQLTGSATVRALAEQLGYNPGTDSASFTYVPRTAAFSGAAPLSGEEEAGTVNLPVVLSTESAGQVTVDYDVDTGAGTASEVNDFTLAAGVLTFAPGIRTNNIPLLILEDSREEPNETVVVQLDSAAGADVGAPSNHVYTIEDDDGPMLEWIAYNDLLWEATEPTANITIVTAWSQGWMHSSSNLVDYATGDPLGVTLSASVQGAYNADWRTQGGNPVPGTDAYTNFSGKVGCKGVLSYSAGDVEIVLSNLSPDRRYTLVVFGNRNNFSYGPAGSNRTTEFTISGADSFSNDSTPGAEILTNSVPNDTAKCCTGYNTELGYVARFTNIDPGPDNTVTVTVQAVSATHQYVNALRVECRRISGTSETEKIAKGSASWRYRKGTEEASSPATDWRRRLFDDSGWLVGTAPIGYGTHSGAQAVATTLSDMYQGYPCVFYRRDFQIDVPGAVEKMKFAIDYDDGFIAWVNGEEIARINLPGNPGDFLAHTNFASNGESSWSTECQGQAIPNLFAGTNVLTVQMFNVGTTSSDCYMDAQLSVVEGSFIHEDDDLDDDSMDDAWEGQTCPGGDGDPAADYDSDGLNTLQEFIAGTHPTNPGSFFELELGNDGADVVVAFDTRQATGTGYTGMARRYALEQRLDLFSGGIWIGVPGHTNLLGDGSTVSYTNPPGQNVEYYRARVWLE